MKVISIFSITLILATALPFQHKLCAQTVSDTLDLSDQITVEPKQSTKSAHWETNSLGMGFGLDYGGIGMNLTQYVGESFGLFGGLGYNLDKMAYNVGVRLRLHKVFHTKDHAPFLIAMYGYNTVLIFESTPKITTTIYGMSYGMGMDWRLGHESNSFFSLAILIPVRGSELDKYHVNQGDVSPVLISLGMRVTLN